MDTSSTPVPSYLTAPEIDGPFSDPKRPPLNASEASTLTMPPQQRNTTFEDAIHVMTQQFTNTIRALVEEKPKTKRTKTPFTRTFSGEELEDPAVFIIKIEKYFTLAEIQDDDEKCTLFSNQLRGEAREWYRPYSQIEETYEEMRMRFLTYFTSTEKVSAATAILYGAKQKYGEKVTPFIVKKQGLFARLAPHTAVEFQTDLIINQLDPEIRSRLRGRRFDDLEELITAAAQVEKDLINSRPIPRGNQGPPRREEGPSGNFRPANENDTSRKKPTSRCTHCQGWHLPSECNRNPARRDPRPMATPGEASHSRDPSN